MPVICCVAKPLNEMTCLNQRGLHFRAGNHSGVLVDDTAENHDCIEVLRVNGLKSE
jgi:hypothetical protein